MLRVVHQAKSVGPLLARHLLPRGDAMTTKNKSAGVNRRQFLSGATAGVAAAALTNPAVAQQGSRGHSGVVRELGIDHGLDDVIGRPPVVHNRVRA